MKRRGAAVTNMPNCSCYNATKNNKQNQQLIPLYTTNVILFVDRRNPVTLRIAFNLESFFLNCFHCKHGMIQEY